ncbi:hypothetical protein A5768_25690 [Mycolicibacterium fortuitum]|uniref:hypothetical protein n=1 Tax=Mycolicibacterium fortuitum TaxID=1766 RepID=UPI0007EC1060|nr:hypothetical protein [Mycolicibacterium fortuitum]OBG21503.1 hypothetical protein A5768_25690 [Mycolicibacterium fortuitum]
MSDNVTHLPGSDVAIRALHAEIEQLAAKASTAYISRTPVRVSNNGIGDEMTFWYDGEHIKVFTCDGTVFISGIEHGGYWPDWYCLRRGEAREIANALYSASAYIESA